MSHNPAAVTAVNELVKRLSPASARAILDAAMKDWDFPGDDSHEADYDRESGPQMVLFWPDEYFGALIRLVFAPHFDMAAWNAGPGERTDKASRSPWQAWMSVLEAFKTHYAVDDYAGDQPDRASYTASDSSRHRAL